MIPGRRACRGVHVGSRGPESVSTKIPEHGGFELMREKKSLGLARELFGIEATLSQDHALGVRKLQRSRHALTHPILWLARGSGDSDDVSFNLPGVHRAVDGRDATAQTLAILESR